MKTLSTIQKNARTAGWAYLLIIVTSILAMILGPYKLMVKKDMPATINNIAGNPILFRAGFTYDLLMFTGVIILSVALYSVLKYINKPMATIALLSRFGEAILGSLTVICGVAIMLLISDDQLSGSNQKTVSLLFDIKDALMNLVFAFLGFGSMLYCYLFYKSRFIPRALAAFGFLAFALVFVESILVLLFNSESSAIAGVPAILFEITIGFWLSIKGVNTQSLHDKYSEKFQS